MGRGVRVRMRLWRGCGPWPGRLLLAGAVLMGGREGYADRQASVVQQSSTPAPALTPAPAVAAGGVIRGSVKAGSVPLPGVAVTATNTLTGKRFATTTDVAGTFRMAIPRNGRYVVKAELAAFATVTEEVLLNAAGENGGKPEAGGGVRNAAGVSRGRGGCGADGGGGADGSAWGRGAVLECAEAGRAMSPMRAREAATPGRRCRRWVGLERRRGRRRIRWR